MEGCGAGFPTGVANMGGGGTPQNLMGVGGGLKSKHGGSMGELKLLSKIPVNKLI